MAGSWANFQPHELTPNAAWRLVLRPIGDLLTSFVAGARCKKREQPCPGYRNLRDRRSVRLTDRTRQSSAPSTNAASTSSLPLSEASTFQGLGPASSNEDVGFSHPASRSFNGPSRSKGWRAMQDDGISRPSSPPRSSLPQNFADQAVCFFFHQYIVKANDVGSPGFLNFVPELYKHSEPDNALTHSIMAISFISLSAQSSVKTLAARGHEHYRTTLKRVTRMLESPEEAIQDSLIVAILLLVLFENITREKPAVMMSHARGLHTLLLHRGEDQLWNVRGLAIFRHVHAHTVCTWICIKLVYGQLMEFLSSKSAISRCPDIQAPRPYLGYKDSTLPTLLKAPYGRSSALVKFVHQLTI